jgi:tetratricopeptide (TPR) repeat protein
MNSWEEISCPLCRTDVATAALLPQQLYQNAAHFCRLAHHCKRQDNIQEVQRCCNLARNEISKITLGGYWKEENVINTVVRQLFCELSELEGDYSDAIERASSIIAELKQESTPESCIRENAECNMLIARCLMNLGRHKEAQNFLCDASDAVELGYKTHSTLETGSLIPILGRTLHFLFSRCLYEQGLYEASIMEAEIAIEQNRHYDGVYEYLVKSLLALGKNDLAIVMMKRAVRNEAPWDKLRNDCLRQQLAALEEDKARFFLPPPAVAVGEMERAEADGEIDNSDSCIYENIV